MADTNQDPPQRSREQLLACLRELDNNELIRLSVADGEDGDVALDVLFERHWGYFLCCVRARKLQTQDLEDALHRGYIKLREGRRRYNPQAGVSWRSWAGRVIGNAGTDLLRSLLAHRPVTLPGEDMLAAPLEPSPTEEAESAEERAALTEAASRCVTDPNCLDEMERRFLREVKLDRIRTASDFAAEYGREPSWATWLWKRILKKLGLCIQQRLNGGRHDQ